MSMPALGKDATILSKSLSKTVSSVTSTKTNETENDIPVIFTKHSYNNTTDKRTSERGVKFDHGKEGGHSLNRLDLQGEPP